MKELITIADLDKWDACCREPGEKYDDEHMDKLFRGRPGLTPQEFLELPVKPEDLIWVATRFLDSKQRQQFANLCADRAVRNHALNCGVAEVEQWVQKWLDGTDRSRAAARAAWEATREDAREVAREDARDARAASAAAWAAASAADATGAADTSAAAAAAAAASYAASDSERKRQLEQLKKIVDTQTQCGRKKSRRMR